MSDADISWDGGKARIGRSDLVVHIYLRHIAELRSLYSYFDLKRGYYIKYLDEYYKIHDDGRGKREIIRHLGGDRRFYRTLIAKKVTRKEYRFSKELVLPLKSVASLAVTFVYVRSLAVWVLKEFFHFTHQK